MKRAGMSLLLAGVLLALIQFTGCADTPATFNKVTIVSPRGAQIIGQGQKTVSIQVSVLNDSACRWRDVWAGRFWHSHSNEPNHRLVHGA